MHASLIVHVMPQTAPVSTREMSNYEVAPLYLPSRGDPGQREQMPSERASTTGLPVRQKKTWYRGTYETKPRTTLLGKAKLSHLQSTQGH